MYKCPNCGRKVPDWERSEDEGTCGTRVAEDTHATREFGFSSRNQVTVVLKCSLRRERQTNPMTALKKYGKYIMYTRAMPEDTTTIRVRRDTKERLEKHGRMNESFDELLNRILDELEGNKLEG
ncbi:hypothetical protein AKJ64_05110 [candidate division MSBL1 archaeon SCGC-AAA259E17]|uniref:Uncharacterized protein n=1 Tax=candidate division MSBL1 archaeon SCGC-AAA259E17 TaxID=1698263 RepID=A0A133U9W5_9EURY|nr:hypothetical protein AKJ64_05110 [candidate division MSBL1 archaeon SCGC-AAA259E17]